MSCRAVPASTLEGVLATAAAHGHGAALWQLLPVFAGPEHGDTLRCAVNALGEKRQAQGLTLLLDAGVVEASETLLRAAAAGWPKACAWRWRTAQRRARDE
jgi:hypothetical protein